MRNPVALLPFAVVVFVGATACAPEPGPEPPPQKEVTVSVDEGGVVDSPDGNFVMDVPPDSLLTDSTFSVTERPAADAFDPDVTLSNVYEVELVDGDLAIVFRAELAFVVSRGEVDRRGEANLGVAHGEVVGEAHDEVLAGAYDDERGAFVAETVGLSWFALIDATDDEPPVCACDADPDACDVDCACDEACEPPDPGLCEAACMSTPGAVCCESCADCNLVEFQCQPLCPEGSVWDCELGCCFESGEGVCVS